MSASIVFAIAEVAQVICGHLQDDRKSLLSLVYCNKAISETALDVLWAKMDSLKPFVQFIPEEVRDACWDIDISTKEFLQLTSPPIEKWKTFDKYSRRVKELYSADPSAAWVNGQRLIYPRLAALRARTGVDLFPNLHHITCFLSDMDIRSEKLLPPTLRSLTSFVYGFMSEEDREDYRNTLLQLSSHAPLVEHLCLRASGTFYFGHAKLAQPPNLKRLRVVDLTRVSLLSHDLQFLFHAICDSPVEELSICMRYHLPDKPQLDIPIFPVLRRLTCCGDADIAHHFLTRVTSTAVVEFTIEQEDKIARLDAYKALLGLLHERFSDSLKSLHLNIGRSGADTGLYYFLAHTLVELVPLVEAGLEDLQYSMCIDKKYLPEALQRALEPSFWPTLRNFTFSTRSTKHSDHICEERMRHLAPFFEKMNIRRIEHDAEATPTELEDQGSSGQ